MGWLLWLVQNDDLERWRWNSWCNSWFHHPCLKSRHLFMPTTWQAWQLDLLYIFVVKGHPGSVRELGVRYNAGGYRISCCTSEPLLLAREPPANSRCSAVLSWVGVILKLPRAPRWRQCKHMLWWTGPQDGIDQYECTFLDLYLQDVQNQIHR